MFNPFHAIDMSRRQIRKFAKSFKKCAKLYYHFGDHQWKCIKTKYKWKVLFNGGVKLRKQALECWVFWEEKSKLFFFNVIKPMAACKLLIFVINKPQNLLKSSPYSGNIIHIFSSSTHKNPAKMSVGHIQISVCATLLNKQKPRKSNPQISGPQGTTLPPYKKQTLQNLASHIGKLIHIIP